MSSSRIKQAAAALLCACTLVSSGCMGARSPDEYGYALVIGVDQGKEKPFYISMLLQRGNGGQQSSESDICPLVGVECEDLFEAVELIESGVPFALNLSRTTAIVFGEEAARSGTLEQLLSASLGTLHIRYYANLIAVRGQAQEYLCGLQSELNPNIAKMQYSFVEYGATTGYIPAITLAQFYDRAWNEAGDIVMPLGMLEKQSSEEGGKDKSGAGQPAQSSGGEKEKSDKQAEQAPTPSPTADILGEQDYLPGQTGREGGLDSGMIGSALFHGAQLKGFLNGPHTQLLLMATGEFQTGRLRLPDPKGRLISVLLQRKGEPRTTLLLGEHPSAQFQLSLYASVEQPAAVADTSREELARYFSEYLQEGMRSVFYACRDLGCDAFELGKAAVMQFTATDQWESFDWPAAYAKTEANFSVEILLEYNPTQSRLE
jgi:hypothetical protein